MGSLSEEVWSGILGFVRTRYPALARNWFDQLAPGKLDGGELAIIAENPAQLRYLIDYGQRPFTDAAQTATGRLIGVRFTTATGDTSTDRYLSTESDVGRDDLSPIRLNSAYVFDNFVIGPCNRLAHASCVAISEAPGAVYNPLFVHGCAGLGKTHLLQAVCHRAWDTAPGSRIAYLTCEMFVNRFIEAVEKRALEDFRQCFRHVDILLIDDIQFITGKERSQEEFFHTFNALYQLHKQIILSADCSPSEIANLEERLVSRFKWGMVARIEAPCLETRLAIIKKKARLLDLALPDDVSTLLASRINSNTRELEGALNRLQGLAKLDGRPVDRALAEASLAENPAVAAKPIKLQDIVGVITQCFDVRVSDLQGRRRSRSIALPRQVGMYLARQFTSHSLEEIGTFFGGRDHTTVLHANKLISRRRLEDSTFRMRLEEIEGTLRR